ncbi:MAG: hypothetical protein BWY19_00426 [bacterium ADurb.Bin212]|nr:MAG: hypothetical protein BWY19_00426 [bacterium ADurb.Bin212]
MLDSLHSPQFVASAEVLNLKLTLVLAGIVALGLKVVHPLKFSPPSSWVGAERIVPLWVPVCIGRLTFHVSPLAKFISITGG